MVAEGISNTDIIHIPADRILDAIRDNLNADILFVDHEGDRQSSVREGMRLGIPYIVLHDFQEKDLNAIVPEKGYHVLHNIGNHMNPTALYTNCTAMARDMTARPPVTQQPQPYIPEYTTPESVSVNLPKGLTEN
jgi:hypothetical protein